MTGCERHASEALSDCAACAREAAEVARVEALLVVTREEPDALTLAGFAARTAERAARERSVSRRSWLGGGWRPWAVPAALVAAVGLASALRQQPSGDRREALLDAATALHGLAVDDDDVDYELALDALSEEELEALDHWLEQDPT